jgi:hypothetical protein
MQVLRKQSYPQYYQTLDDFADALDTIVMFNVNRPEHVFGGGRFREHKATMKELGIGADRGDMLLKEQRQAARDLSELDIDAAVSYVRTIAIFKREPAMLQTLHLPMKMIKMPRKGGATIQKSEIRLDLKHVKGLSGAIMVMGALIGGHGGRGGPFLVNLCKGEPVSEDSWYNPGGHYTSCGKIILKDLEPANKYYVRMRTDGPEGPGPWSQVVSIIVL